MSDSFVADMWAEMNKERLAFAQFIEDKLSAGQPYIEAVSEAWAEFFDLNLDEGETIHIPDFSGKAKE